MRARDSAPSLFITCVGLYAAWNMNKRPKLEISGPIGREPREAVTPAADGALPRMAAGAAAVGLGLWKLKAFVPMAATLLLSFAAYWTAFGWRFAAGLVISLWIHEMGHVLALARAGIRAELPMFIPGLGAYVRWRRRPEDAHLDAPVALAGPLFGGAAALVCLGVRALGGSELWLGLANMGALMNLLNLTPLLGLDGERVFHALSQGERALCTLALGVALGLSSQPILWLPLAGAVYRLIASRAPREGRLAACVTFIALTAGLTAVASVRF
jgi:Zn-dependent protease